MSSSLKSALRTRVWDTETSMSCLKEAPSTPSPWLVGLQCTTTTMTPSLASLLILTLKLSPSLLSIPQRISVHLTHCFTLRQTSGLVSSACLSWRACVHPSQHSTHATLPSCLSYANNIEVLWLHTQLWFLQLDQYTLLPLNFYFKALFSLPFMWFSIGFRYNSLIKALGFVARQ